MKLKAKTISGKEVTIIQFVPDIKPSTFHGSYSNTIAITYDRKGLLGKYNLNLLTIMEN